MQMVQSMVMPVTWPLWLMEELNICDLCHVLWHHCHYIIMCAEVIHLKLSQNEQSSYFTKRTWLIVAKPILVQLLRNKWAIPSILGKVTEGWEYGIKAVHLHTCKHLELYKCFPHYHDNTLYSMQPPLCYNCILVNQWTEKVSYTAHALCVATISIYKIRI